MIESHDDIRINDIVHYKSKRTLISCRVIDRKDMKVLYNKNYTLFLIELPDNRHEWINSNYLIKKTLKGDN